MRTTTSGMHCDRSSATDEALASFGRAISLRPGFADYHLEQRNYAAAH